MNTYAFMIVAIIIVLIMLVIFRSENLIPVSYTSGATQRFMSIFSEPTQGTQTTEYNMETEAMERRKREYLAKNAPFLTRDDAKKEVMRESQAFNKFLYGIS